MDKLPYYNGPGGALVYEQVFPLGPDGKRHPNQEEIFDTIEALEIRDAPDDVEVISMLRRIATVAPKEEKGGTK